MDAADRKIPKRSHKNMHEILAIIHTIQSVAICVLSVPTQTH